MENISWSEEQVLSVIKEFCDEIDGICVKCPEFQHVEFVKGGLLYLKRAKMTNDWTITDSNETALAVLNYFNEITANENLFVSSNDDETISLKSAIQKIYDATLAKIPDKEEYSICYRGQIFNVIFDKIIHSAVFPTYEKSWYSDEKKSFFVKGFSCLSQLLIKKVIKLEDKITCVFDTFDESYLFFLALRGGNQLTTMEKNTVFISTYK